MVSNIGNEAVLKCMGIMGIKIRITTEFVKDGGNATYAQNGHGLMKKWEGIRYLGKRQQTVSRYNGESLDLKRRKKMRNQLVRHTLERCVREL